MEFGSIIEKPQLTGSDLTTRYVGFSDYNVCIKKYFSQETIDTISRNVTSIRSFNHNLFTYVQSKTALTSYYDKMKMIDSNQLVPFGYVSN